MTEATWQAHTCELDIVPGPGATVVRNTDAGPTLTEPARVTGRETGMMEEEGPGEHAGIWSAWQGEWAGRLGLVREDFLGKVAV